MDDDEACGEVVGDDGGVKMGGRKWESGRHLNFFKSIFITNF